MKYRWLLGLLVSLTACSNGDDGDGPSSSGGSGGSASNNVAGSSTIGGSGGALPPGGGTAGSTTPTGGMSQAGSPSGGTNGPAGAGTAGTSPSGGTTANGGTTNGQAGSLPNGGSGGSPPGASASVLERNGGPTREGHWIQPALTKAAAAKMTLDAGFAATFKGNMYASPLYTEKGPGGKGVFIAVSADNVVAALDETDGSTIWSKTLGSSPGSKGQACGFGSDPVGILSTPVIDEQTRTVYVAAAIGTSAVERHEIHALSLDDGASRAGWPVNVSNMSSGGTAFNTRYQNQRSALSLVNGIVYVGYGGFVGDCNDYRGWIVAVDTADPTKTGAFATAGKGDAIWAPGGFASDGTSIFPVTGNNTGNASTRAQTDSEAVLKISGLAKFERSDANQFYPAAWKSMDAADADLGGTNSMLIRVPGSTPEQILVVIAKDGKMYLLDPSDLGGSDGHFEMLEPASVGMAAGSGVKTVPTAYTTSKGTYIALSVESGPICPNNVTGAAIVGIRIEPGTPPTGDIVWCAPASRPITAPVSTTSDGKSDAIVWYMNGSQLRGVDGDTGESVFSGGDCSGVQRWTSPIAVKGRIVVGANGKLCSFKPGD